MYFSKLSLSSLAVLGVIVQSSVAKLIINGTNVCQNEYTDFTKGYGNWAEVSGAKVGYNITEEGLELTLLRPKEFVTLLDKDEDNLPYNEYGSPFAPTFEYNYTLNFGQVTFELKTPGVAGIVTAGILMSDDTGDEVDYEMLGGADSTLVQTNYFYGKTPVYNVNSASHNTVTPTASEFHNYTIDWTPEQINFYINGVLIRSSNNSNECDNAGNCKFPTHPSSVRFGIWDSSTSAGTAQWAQGPVNWNAVTGPVTAYIKSVEVKCNPAYNIMA